MTKYEAFRYPEIPTMRSCSPSRYSVSTVSSGRPRFAGATGISS